MKTSKTLILISNDDSIYAKGLRELTKSLKDDYEVVVCAPDKPQSGKSHAISLDSPLWFKAVNAEGVEAYKCTGTPADCIKLALFKIMKRKPDMVLSGINHGSNSSINGLYSGTMGAACEGALHGIPSIGFSLLNFAPDADFSTACKYVKIIINNVLNNEVPEDLCLNVNIPYNNPENIKGIKICRQSAGQWIEDFEENFHPANRKPYYWLTGNYHNTEPESEDTDESALARGYISVQPVTIDTTDYYVLDKMKNWDFK